MQHLALIRTIMFFQLLQLLFQLIWFFCHQYFCAHFFSLFLILCNANINIDNYAIIHMLF